MSCELLARLAPDQLALFFHTDSIVDGEWQDKGFLVLSAARECGVPLLWQKIVPRLPAGTNAQGRPQFSRLLCFGAREFAVMRKLIAQPDVLIGTGPKTWPRGTGADAARVGLGFAKQAAATTRVINPCSGLGSILAVANYLGLDALGIERSARRAARAETLSFHPERGFRWIEKIRPVKNPWKLLVMRMLGPCPPPLDWARALTCLGASVETRRGRREKSRLSPLSVWPIQLWEIFGGAA